MATDAQFAAGVSVIPLCAEAGDAGQFALFPGESGGGVSISQQEMLSLSQVYSKIYDTYISRLASHFVRQFSMSEPAAKMLARRAVVPLVHCFLDRLLRVKRAIDIAPLELATPRQAMFPAPDTIEAFEQNAVDNPVFNQSMVGFVGRIWQLQDSVPVPEPALYKPQAGFKNNLFRLYPRTPWQLLKRISLRLMARFPISRLPALSMANAQGALAEHGFYCRFIEDVNPKWSMERGVIDHLFREKLFTDEYINTIELNEFLGALGLTNQELEQARQLFKEFLRSYYPSSLLEAIPQNMRFALQSLQKFKRKVLVTSSGRCSRGTYVVAAAKQKGYFIIDHQHGGHYGYLEDVSVILELEYPGVDQFISWGWSRLPKHPAFESMAVLELPSPWLSERKRYWAKLTISDNKEFDVLLMPNMVKRFPAAPQGASTSRIDMIKEMAESLKFLIRKTTDAGISVLNKPYNTTTVGLLAKTYQEMESIGGSLYSVEKQLDKGLTYELLNRCHIVVWDQPGTGFLECLSSGIPTMVYWPRIYSREEEWVKPIFSDLEQHGIIHRNLDSLIKEIVQFKKSPLAWMKDSERKLLANRFCRQFAWASDEWPVYWRRYLDGLKDQGGS